MKRFIVFIALLSVCTSLHADDYLFKGYIGKYPVVFNLFMSGGQVDATYFYTSTYIDVELLGRRTRDGVLLYASKFNEKTSKRDTTETWHLYQQPNKTWSGNCVNNTGQIKEVSLSPLDIANIKHPYAQLPLVKDFKDGDAYNYVRSSMLPVVKDSSLVKNGKYSLQYYRMKHTPIEMFEVVGGGNKQIVAKVNTLLLNKFMEHAWNYCGCIGADTPAYYYKIDNVYLTDNILSVNIKMEYYCNQNAHPEAGSDPLTIDMKTGNELALEDVLDLVTGPLPAANSDKWNTYRSEVYFPTLVTLLKKLYPEQMAFNDECNYGGVEPWLYTQWYITKNGLYLAPSFPHVLSPCRDPQWSYISFEELKKHKNNARHITLP